MNSNPQSHRGTDGTHQGLVRNYRLDGTHHELVRNYVGWTVYNNYTHQVLVRITIGWTYNPITIMTIWEHIQLKQQKINLQFYEV